MNEQMKPINERMKNVINRNKHCKFIRKRSRTNICSIRHQLQRLREAKSIADHKHRRLSSMLTIILINQLTTQVRAVANHTKASSESITHHVRLVG